MIESLLKLEKRFYSRYQSFSMTKGKYADGMAKANKRAWLDVKAERIKLEGEKQ